MSEGFHKKEKSHVALILLALWCLIATMMGSDAHPAEIFKNWENIQHRPGIIKVNFYQGPCSEPQAILIEQEIRYALHSAKTPENTFSYLGRTPYPGYHLSSDNIFTVDCVYPGDMDFIARNGESYPVDSCDTNVTGPTCQDGSTRYLTDAGIHINVITPDWRIKGVVLHELGHALHLLDHSDVPGAVMHNSFNTEFSAQYLETWQPTDWCWIQSQRNVGEQEVTVDDMQWTHVPKVWSVTYQQYYSTTIVPFLMFLGAYTKVKLWESCE